MDNLCLTKQSTMTKLFPKKTLMVPRAASLYLLRFQIYPLTVVVKKTRSITQALGSLKTQTD